MTSYTAEQEALLQAVQQQPGITPDIASAMLFGATGEGNQTDEPVKSAGSGSLAGGYFEFTTPSYPISDATLPASGQVAAIFPSYQQAAARVPSSLTGAARAEWIALNAENPGGIDPATGAIVGTSAQERAQIVATDQPTYYGQNRSYTGQNWSSPYLEDPSITGELAAIGKGGTIAKGTGSLTPSPSTSSNPAKKPSTSAQLTSTSSTEPEQPASDIWTDNPISNVLTDFVDWKPAPKWGSSWLPWNWGSDAFDAAWPGIATALIIIVGLVAVVWGLKITLGHSGGGGGGEPVLVNVEHDAEHAAEAAPLAA